MSQEKVDNIMISFTIPMAFLDIQILPLKKILVFSGINH